MNAIKDKISEKVADSAINYTKKTVKEVIEEDYEKEEVDQNKNKITGSILEKDKELQEATKEIYENTKTYIDTNRDNIILITRKFADIASKVLDKTREKVIETYLESKKEELNKFKNMEEPKQIIIDASTGEEKSNMSKEVKFETSDQSRNIERAIRFDYFIEKPELIKKNRTDILSYLNFTLPASNEKYLVKQ